MCSVIIAGSTCKQASEITRKRCLGLACTKRIVTYSSFTVACKQVLLEFLGGKEKEPPQKKTQRACLQASFTAKSALPLSLNKVFDYFFTTF